LGIEGGYVDNNVRFKQGGTRVNLTGGTFGVYGTYMSGGLFVDGLVAGDFLRGVWSIPAMGVIPNLFQASGDVTTWGGRIEAGYAWPLGANAFIEPVGSLAYGRTSFDNLVVPGGSNATADANTFRGSLGARLGTTATTQYYKVKLAIEGRVWDEFDGKTDTSLIIAGGPNFLN